MKYILIIMFLITGAVVFTENKQMVETVTFPESDIIRKQIYRYDASGKLLTVDYQRLNQTGLIDSSRDIYHYESNGLCNEVLHYGTSGDLMGSKKIYYDDLGRKIKSVSCEPDGYEYYTLIFTYDDKGNLGTLSRFPSSNENTITVFTYDDQGKLREERTQVMESNRIVSRATYEYDDKGTLIEKISMEFPFDRTGTKNLYHYNNRGQLIRDLLYRLEGEKAVLMQTTEYSYND